MLLILKMVADQPSLAEVAIFAASMTLKDRNMSQRFDIVFYVDKETSFKNSERLVRSETHGQELNNITAAQIVRQWGSATNKSKPHIVYRRGKYVH